MTTIRVPYPGDPGRRREVFERAASALAAHGDYEGTPDGGAFRGRTPIGALSGTYRSEPGSEVLEIVLAEKPWLVPTSLIEAEVRKFLTKV